MDKGYLACTACIKDHRDRVRQYTEELPMLEWQNGQLAEVAEGIIGKGWMNTRLREAEYKAQDWEAENLPPEPVIHYEDEIPLWLQPIIYCWCVFKYLMYG